METGTRRRLVELAAYTLAATGALLLIVVLFHRFPVAFTLLIAEDHFGEYATFACFLIAGATLLRLALRAGPRMPRVISAILGVCALLIAAEEVSWGQRIFELEVPQELQRLNYQGELTLHNIVAFRTISKEGTVLALYLILPWVALSAGIRARLPRVEATCQRYGIPLIPIHLIPVFLLAPTVFLLELTAKEGEVIELLLGVAAMTWAVDRLASARAAAPGRERRAAWMVGGALVTTIAIAAGLTHAFPDDLTHRLNLMATRDYPALGMYDQAGTILRYIYAHPRYMTPDTRISHAALLHSIGKPRESREVLVEASRELERDVANGADDAPMHRRLGLVYSLLEDEVKAHEHFSRGVHLDELRLASAVGPDDKSRVLFSVAATMATASDVKGALIKAEEARRLAVSPSLELAIRRYIDKLRAQAPPELLAP